MPARAPVAIVPPAPACPAFKKVDGRSRDDICRCKGKRYRRTIDGRLPDLRYPIVQARRNRGKQKGTRQAPPDLVECGFSQITVAMKEEQILQAVGLFELTKLGRSNRANLQANASVAHIAHKAAPVRRLHWRRGQRGSQEARLARAMPDPTRSERFASAPDRGRSVPEIHQAGSVALACGARSSIHAARHPSRSTRQMPKWAGFARAAKALCAERPACERWAPGGNAELRLQARQP